MDERSHLAKMGSDDLDDHPLHIHGFECRVLWWWYYQWHACSAHSLAIPGWYRYWVRYPHSGIVLAADGNVVVNIRLAV